MKYLIIPKAFIIIALTAFVASDVFAEEPAASPFSISAHVGAFKNQESNFKDRYDTDTFLAYGVEVYLPLDKISKRFGLIGHVTWMTATGVPLMFSSEEGTIRVEEGTAELVKRVSNAGIKLNLPVRGNIGIDIMGGLSHGYLKQVQRDVPGFSDSESKYSKLNGFFGGLGLEYIMNQVPISVVTNFLYNHTFPSLAEIQGKRGGAHLSFGIRYYLQTGN